MKSLESMGMPAGKKEGLSQEEREEAEAEDLLEQLLSKPENAFLLTIPQNRDTIDRADSAREALKFAEKKIAERIKRAMEVHVVSKAEGVEVYNFNYEGLMRNVDSIMRNALEIGRGGDAYVVIDKSEVRELPPEICYKFALAEMKPRGRNSMAVEFEMQEKFYASAQKLLDSRIGVPTPFYSIELGDRKMIAMEKLPAVSIDDILRGKGLVPEWFDIDAFCEELKKIIDHFHAEGLYHRDMHMGNVMISQADSLQEDDKMAYIIDFGLSAENIAGLDPYRKEEAGSLFTYDDDYGIIEKVKKGLRGARNRGA